LAITASASRRCRRARPDGVTAPRSASGSRSPAARHSRGRAGREPFDQQPAGDTCHGRGSPEASAQRTRHLAGAGGAGPVADRDLDHPQAGPAGAADHLQRPALATITDAQGEQGVTADGPERPEVGKRNAEQQTAGQPEGPVGGHRERRHGPGLSSSGDPRSDDQVGLAAKDRPGHRRQVGAIEGAVGVGEGDHLGQRGRLHTGPAGGAEASPGFGDHPGPGGRGHRRGAVAGAVVDHQQVDAGWEGGERGRQGSGLVEGGEHDGDA
jgi:hypothetical protein